MDVRMDGRVAVITGASTGLGLAMAKEFAASGASVALLARKADVLASAKADVVKAAGKTYEEFLAGMAKGRIPLGRMGKAEEFARMACFLCSDAGSFITGVAINVDGGASPVV